MSTHLAKVKPRIMELLPSCTPVSGCLPKLPLLTLAANRGQLLFFGKNSGLLSSLTFPELCKLYESYLSENYIISFLKKHRIDVTPKIFAEALPYLLISCDSVCPICKGTQYIAKVANRSAFRNPDGYYVDYACSTVGCQYMIRGNGTHCPECRCTECTWSISKVRAGLLSSQPDRAAPSELQSYLLAVIDVYVPEAKSRIIHQYAKGNIKLTQVEDLTGIKMPP